MTLKNWMLSAFVFWFCGVSGQAQTSWIGGGTDWFAANNWTAGVPTATLDAIIGDANFTGTNQPTLAGSTAVTCQSLTIGGVAAATLNVKYTLTVASNLTIAANGTLIHNTTKSITVKGSWSNSGIYSPTNNSSKIIFAGGASQTLGGAAVTTFRTLTINSGSTTLLAANVIVNTLLTVTAAPPSVWLAPPAKMILEELFVGE